MEYATGPFIPGSKHGVLAQVGSDRYGSFFSSTPRASAVFIVPEPCPLTLSRAAENILNRIIAYNLTKDSGYGLDTKIDATMIALNYNQTSIAREKLSCFIDEIVEKGDRINSASPLSLRPLESQFVDMEKAIVKAIDSKKDTVQYRW